MRGLLGILLLALLVSTVVLVHYVRHIPGSDKERLPAITTGKEGQSAEALMPLAYPKCEYKYDTDWSSADGGAVAFDVTEPNGKKVIACWVFQPVPGQSMLPFSKQTGLYSLTEQAYAAK